ncbi:ISL3-like element ISLdl1 family transposase, partial [Lactobacillus delbrueckii subsp. lactis]|nr:ISL3-like element ISLdl1 family transposase [Lactobacillus delbrueckii subsp. lactis]
MNYTELSVATQDVMPNKGVLFFKSGLSDFIQVGEPIQNEDGLTFVGKLDECGDTFCPNCSRKLVKNGSLESTLKHVAIGGIHTNIRVSYARFRCLNIDCQFNTRSQSIPFKADGYRITKPLKEYTEKLLSYGLTLKAVAWLTGLDKMTVKSIHKSLLLSKFTTDGKTLIKPERQAKYLAIDEFKLHDGHKYATAIIDWETGYILYLAHGKKKAVVFEFMDHVGDEWMSKVEAVACDMNSDFEEAFK